MEKCNICPRKCNVSRDTELGFCRQRNVMKVAKVMLHHFEEPIICGGENGAGSGAIFFAGCSLGCAFCQNYQISKPNSKNPQIREVSPEKLVEIFKNLEKAGALNINLVTPTHFTLQILQSLKIYKPKIPIIWNTSGYELPETIKLLDGFVDIFLVDFKYFDKNISKKYAFAENYAENCEKSLLEMRKLQPRDVIKNGIMKKGVIVRHLAMPSHTADSLKIIDFVCDKLGKDTIFSLMSQYVPMGGAAAFPEINRRLTPLEYKVLVSRLEKLQMENSFIQDLDSACSSFTPDFFGGSDSTLW